MDAERDGNSPVVAEKEKAAEPHPGYDEAGCKASDLEYTSRNEQHNIR